MQTYLVGGAVRDALLGLPVVDRDWVVVGSTPEALGALGFVPVGKDFPVFLHPKTHEEYALARTERKTARGYKGFEVSSAPEVTLEQDLARRDLTINAIAAHTKVDSVSAALIPDLDALIDPYGGVRDIELKIFRHVTEAFREDPVRILRLARFAARFTDFTVAPDTLVLMRAMVDEGEIDALVAERVWQELARALMESQPSRMLQVLRDCGALARLMPEVNKLWDEPQRPDGQTEIDSGTHLMSVLDQAAKIKAPLSVRFACLVHDLGKGTTAAEELPFHIGDEERSARLSKILCERLRVPIDCRELAQVVAKEHNNIHSSATLNAAALVRLLERCDAFRKPQRFAEVLLACECAAHGTLALQNTAYPPREQLLLVLATAQSVATASIAEAAQAQGIDGKKIGELIYIARVDAVHSAMQK
ncbi:Multifunctional CCA protein [Polaromonas vacuolata]|uniref:Multifunctional CCA protein n=1 Tax=Polaromonas vacuolata TaxID=37448 RepID=A0A6H2HCS1_9BURK|nr:multifunctional CCA addition/repair protein [Polaromonas vacuolata]QJC57679.1 Multifunctional CCA protein [Polaromonas vacuolata]